MVKLAKNKGYQILTDTGWSDFDSVAYIGNEQCITIITNNYRISATFDHEFFDTNYKKITAESLIIGDKIIAKDKIETVLTIKKTGSIDVYDVYNVDNNNRFYADNILVSNCKFIIYDETLVAPSKLIDLTGIDPVEKQGQVRWYNKPVRGNIYIVALDPSLGTGGDPAAIQIFDATRMEQIGEWTHNLTPIQQQVGIMANICTYIADITKDPTNLYYSVENNTIGEAALNAIADLGEEHIPGDFLSEPSKMGASRRYRKGFNTTNASKLAACAKFKLWVETDKLKLRSKLLISELKSFVAHGNSYQAKIGEHDDLVSATLLVVRIIVHLRQYDVSLSTGLTMDKSEIIPPMPFVAMF